MTLQQLWYGRSSLSLLLAPLAGLFCGLVTLRRAAYRAGLRKSWRAPVPILVVGNINIGGVGKTPLVVWLVRHLQAQGYRPGVVSRGYGGQAKQWPQQVRPDSDVTIVGDEAVVIARQTKAPMAVAPDRVVAIQSLLEHADVDIVISDDGLQHYAMQRDLEIVVVDGVRRFGNGWCFPAGPLREPESRLHSVDLIVNNGTSMRGEFAMMRRLGRVYSLLDENRSAELDSFKGQTLHAVAGIGYPERYFRQLSGLGLDIQRHAFADHHTYSVKDLQFDDDAPVLMTAKDAVKCQAFADQRLWVVDLELELDPVFATRLQTELAQRGIQPMLSAE